MSMKEIIIKALVASAFSVIGFFGGRYFEQKDKQQVFVEQIYKGLYDKNSEVFNKIQDAYSNYHQILSEKYGLTSYQLKEPTEKFKDAINDYSKYFGELERFGNSGQIEVAKSLYNWLTHIYSEYEMQYSVSEMYQRKISNLLYSSSDFDDEELKKQLKLLDVELDRLIQSENRMYYEVSLYEYPMVKGLEQYLNYQFRDAIGLGITQNIEESINNLSKMKSSKKENEYVESDLPFGLARSRRYSSPTIKFEGDLSNLKIIEELIKEEIRGKFIIQAIEHDENLKKLLETRKKQNKK